MTRKLKDHVLSEIVQSGGNTAQFVSFGPDGVHRYHAVRNVPWSHVFENPEQAARALKDSGAPFVNIRCLKPDKPDGNPFIMGRDSCRTPEKIAVKASELMQEGYTIILNEEIDVRNGAISGVRHGGAAVFSAFDTPRCVNKPGCTVIPSSLLPSFVRAVYDRPFHVPFEAHWRVEFTVGPGQYGFYRQNYLVWQAEEMNPQVAPREKPPVWPSSFSKDVGDKTFGLLMGHLIGLPVPRTRVYGRIVPEFEFGERTGSREEKVFRPAPREFEPGYFPSLRGYTDPYGYMNKHDPECADETCKEKRGSEARRLKKRIRVCVNPQHRRIASLLMQDAVVPRYSGKCITDAEGQPIIRGRTGRGDAFMTGEDSAEELPWDVQTAVRGLWGSASAMLGPASFEWVYDRDGSVMVVQLHRGQTQTLGDIVVPWDKEPAHWEYYKTAWGLPKFRQLAERAVAEGFGIVLQTEDVLNPVPHECDIVRRAGIPSRMELIT